MLGEKEFVLNVDFYDYAFFLKRVITEEDIKDLFLRAKKAGFDRVNWRLSVCGKLAYYTKAGHRFDGEGEKGRPESKYLVETMEQLDPLEVAVRYAKELGIQIFAWYTPFDQGLVSLFSNEPYGGLTCDFLKQNPQFQMVSRDGKEYFKGVPCFACPEVQAYHLAIVKEFLAYGVDGIHLALTSHSPRAASADHLDFGYNQPIVDEYKKRFGVDIRNEEFDVFQWGRLRGEYLTEFLRKARKEVEKCKGEIEIFIPGVYGDFNRTYYMLYFDWETWAKEELMNYFAVAHEGPYVSSLWYYEILYRYDPANPKVFVQKKSSYERKLKGVKLYVRSGTPKNIKDVLGFFKESAFDGVIIHEALNLEPEASNLWGDIENLTKVQE